MYERKASVDMDISVDIHGKSVDMDMDMDMDGKFHIHGKPVSCCQRQALFSPPPLSAKAWFLSNATYARQRNGRMQQSLSGYLCVLVFASAAAIIAFVALNGNRSPPT